MFTKFFRLNLSCRQRLISDTQRYAIQPNPSPIWGEGGTWLGMPLFHKFLGIMSALSLETHMSNLKSVLSILLPLACHIFSHWAMPKFHLHSRREDANKRFLGLSLTLPLAFFPCYVHKEIALLLLQCESKKIFPWGYLNFFFIFSQTVKNF